MINLLDPNVFKYQSELVCLFIDLLKKQEYIFIKHQRKTNPDMKIRLTLTFLLPALLLGQTRCHSLRYQNNTNIVTIALMGTNDLHGTAFPKSLYRRDNKQQYKYGGLVYMARLMNIIKQQYGQRAIYLDTGDQYQGGIQSGPQASKGQIIADFFNALDLRASALGNHEFDYGQQFLLNYLNAKNSSSLAANLFSEDGQPNFLPKHKSSQIFQLNGIKLGVIGLATTETPTTTSGFISKKFPQYKFNQYPQIVIRQSAQLRRQGAQIVVVLAHFGNKCQWNKTYDIRTNQTQQQQCQNDEIITFIDQLPSGIIDGILCGHRHQFVHHWYKNIPFMGAIDGGYYFNVMYFYFDTASRKVVGTAIEGPIPVCERLFQNTRTCQFHNDQELVNAGPLTSWVFHQQPVFADDNILRLFQDKYVPMMQKFTSKLVENQLKLARVKDRENPLANLITSLMMKVAQSKGHEVDFSLINHGAFRSTWYPGVIQDQHFYNMFPFENFLSVFQIQGSDLKEMIKRVQNGWDGFYFFDGIFQTLKVQKIISQDDENDFYFQKGFVNATLLSGKQIQDERMYKGTTVEFILHGGDDFIKCFGQYYNPETKQNYRRLAVYNIDRIGEQRQELHKQLQILGFIRQSEWRVSKQKPRMVVLQI